MKNTKKNMRIQYVTAELVSINIPRKFTMVSNKKSIKCVFLPRAAPLPESSPMSEDEESKEETCQEHGQTIQFYCRTCVALICTICQENAHRAHTLELPLETAERHSGVLKKYKEDMINYMAIYDTVLNDLTDELAQANAQRESSLNLLAENTQRLIAKVQDCEHQLKAEINTAADEAVAEYETLQTKMMTEKETLSETVGEINSVINGRPPIEVIRARVKQNLTYKKILNQNQPPAALPKFNLNIELQPYEQFIQVESIGKVVHQLTRPRPTLQQSAPPFSRERHRPRSTRESLSPTPPSRGFQWTRRRSSADLQAYGSTQSRTSADPSAYGGSQSVALADGGSQSRISTDPSAYGGSHSRTSADLSRPPPPYEEVMEQQQWPAAPSVSLSNINFEQAIQFFLPWHPGGMCYTRDGNIVVCECVGRDVHVYSPQGKIQ